MWREILNKPPELLVLPWFHGSTIRSGDETLLVATEPPSPGAHIFKRQLAYRRLDWEAPSTIVNCRFINKETGYLIGNRFVHRGLTGVQCQQLYVDDLPEIYLLPDHLEKFARVVVGQIADRGPWFFIEETLPLGPELDAQNLLLQNKEVAELKGATHELQFVYKKYLWLNAEALLRQQEVAATQESARRQAEAEARQKDLRSQSHSSVVRRTLAREDMVFAVQAALSLSGARLLECIPYQQRYRVRFEFQGRRFECVCDNTLQIYDAGICLTDERTGKKYDSLHTIESLPSVIQEAINRGKLVVFRRF